MSTTRATECFKYSVTPCKDEEERVGKLLARSGRYMNQWDERQIEDRCCSIENSTFRLHDGSYCISRLRILLITKGDSTYAAVVSGAAMEFSQPTLGSHRPIGRESWREEGPARHPGARSGSSAWAEKVTSDLVMQTPIVGSVCHPCDYPSLYVWKSNIPKMRSMQKQRSVKQNNRNRGASKKIEPIESCSVL